MTLNGCVDSTIETNEKRRKERKTKNEKKRKTKRGRKCLFVDRGHSVRRNKTAYTTPHHPFALKAGRLGGLRVRIT